MKVIFLDHDGVLCGDKEYKEWELTGGEFPPFNCTVVEMLNEIVILTGAKIVCSSDWRKYLTVHKMRKLYKEQGLVGELIGFTRIWGLSSTIHQRNLEIEDWLKDHSEITHWVAIDDFPVNVEHLVHTDSKVGMSRENKTQALEILGWKE